MTFLLTVLRGLRSRALLSAGAVLLTALAIGSAVLGPVFSVAVTDSFLVSQLNAAPNIASGLSWVFTPAATDDPDAAQQHASSAAGSVIGARGGRQFAAPQTTLTTSRVSSVDGQVTLSARAGQCDHLEVTGRCPSRAGEVALLGYDLDLTGISLGQSVDLGQLGTVTVVGSYRAIAASQEDFWFNPFRYQSTPARTPPRGPPTPYLPAPWITPSSTFDALPAGSWQVQVDRRLAVSADLTVSDLATALDTSRVLKEPSTSVSGGDLAPDSTNSLGSVVSEVQAQQSTARRSIGPAVFSLVLVALALLLRLLTAAADLRLPELALASLRGLPRRRMWQLGLSEPLAVLALATPVGAVLGVLGALALVRAWLVPGLPLVVPLSAVATGLLVVLGTLAVAAVAVGQVLRVSLSEQLTGVRRPRRAGRLAVLAQLVLVALVVSVLASKLSAGRPGDPDVSDLALPVLLAVVAGLAAARVTAWAATRWTRLRQGGSLPGYVAARALSRRQEGTLVILPITAALAVSVFGVGIYDSAAQWRASVAATIAPADEVYLASTTLPETVAATHRIDPRGRYLMAATTLSTQGPTLVIADTTRLARVADWPDQWTPGLSTSEIADRLSLHSQVPTFRGSHLAIRVDQDVAGVVPLTLQLSVGAPDGTTRSVFLGPYNGSGGTASADVGFCDRGEGCTLQGMVIGGPAGSPTPLAGTVTIGDVSVDGKPLTGAVRGAGWVSTPGATQRSSLLSLVTGTGDIVLTLDSGEKPVAIQLSSGSLPAQLPVVAGVDARLATPATADAVGLPVRSVVTARSVPLLGPFGVLIDYRTLTTDRSVLDQATPVYVLARGDTPAAMIDALRESGATSSTTLASETRLLGQSAYALALRLYAVVAALVLLMALAGLFVSTAVQLPARRRDAASLRVLGVPRRAVVSATVRELAIVLGSTAVAGLAAGTLAQYVVLRTVRLGYVTSITTPALVASIDPVRLALLAVLAVVVLGVVAVLSAVLVVRGARGATLRESAR